MPDTIRDAIRENAVGPKAASTDNLSVTQHSLDDQIKAAKFVADEESASKPHRGLRFTKMVMPETSS
jgi:hypothetical protein